MVGGKTKHYKILREYVREVAEDLVARGKVRREYGQTIDTVIQHETQTVIAEVAGDVRALAVELGIGVVVGGATLMETFVRQTTNEILLSGTKTLIEMLTGGQRKKA